MKRNKFSLSHYKLYTSDMGELVPTSITEVLPGDTIQQNTNLLVRTSPLFAPVYHPVHVRIHHWFVPHRLIWVDWEDFITGGPDGMDSSVFPTINLTDVSGGDLAEYLGVPNGFVGEVSALPFRAYNLIWNEFYRDQDLQAELPISEASGPDTATSIALQNVCWEKDYFTSARPWEQKGPAVSIPLTGTAPVEALGPLAFQNIAAAPVNLTGNTGNTQTLWSSNPTASGSSAAYSSGLLVNLSGVSAVTITALREALAIQRYEEARARYGSRYVEYLRYLGVRSSDARLQRPEYLGGGRSTIQFSEVLQTAPGPDDNGVVGELKGHGISALRSNRYRRFFEEHGYVITLVSILPKTMYMQGLFRHWNRRTKDDFWQREFQHIGQQAIKNKEIQAGASFGDIEATFGYQDRYDEYRRAESTVAGEFRSALNFWHLAREFTAMPALNDSFVKSVPSERIFASPANDVLWVMARHSIQARRMISKVGTSFIY